jgi:hypothetical protein
MRKVPIALLSVALLACGDQPTTPSDSPAFDRLDDADQGGMRFTTTLTGAEEAPGPGDPDGTGTFTMTVNPGLGLICYEIEVQNITLPAAASHIHIAPAGSPGPVRVPLMAPGADGKSAACTAVGDAAAFTDALLLDLRKNPASYYVNVHTSDFPAGAVRGQLGD